MNIVTAPKGTYEEIKAHYATKDIIKEVLHTIQMPIETQTAALAARFTPDYAGLKALYSFEKNNISYQEDPDGKQWIREPARLWADGEGDCKSKTIFICSVLKNWGMPFTVRFVSYEKRSRTVTHVYAIAHLNGQDVIMDTVWNAFDSQKTPYYFAQDYNFNNMALAHLSGIGSAAELENLARMAQQMTDFVAHLPRDADGIDITQLSEAEAIRYLSPRVLGGTAIAGIGRASDHLAAFTLPGILIGNELMAINGILDKVKEAGKKVIDKIKEALKVFLNWVFKEGLKKAAPFFSFAFIQKSVSPLIDAKRVKQQKIISWVAKVTGTSEAVVMSSIADGIKAQTGKTPQQLLNAAAGGTNISGIGFVLTATMIATAVEVLTKIIAFLKKNKAELPAPIDKDSGSDLEQLTQAAQAKPVADETVIVPPNVPTIVDKVQTPETTAERIKPLPKANTEGGRPPVASDNSNLLLWGGAAALLFALSK